MNFPYNHLSYLPRELVSMLLDKDIGTYRLGITLLGTDHKKLIKYYQNELLEKEVKLGSTFSEKRIKRLYEKWRRDIEKEGLSLIDLITQ